MLGGNIKYESYIHRVINNDRSYQARYVFCTFVLCTLCGLHVMCCARYVFCTLSVLHVMCSAHYVLCTFLFMLVLQSARG